MASVSETGSDWQVRTKPAVTSASSSAKFRRMCTAPPVTLARQVPHTPPLHANGRSGRARWAHSRTVTSRASDTVVERPSSMMVASLVAPAGMASACRATGGGMSST